MRKTVLIAFAGTELEAAAIRAAAESFGASVFFYPIGRPADFLSVLTGTTGFPEPDAVIFSFHGENGACLMPELGEDVYFPDEPRGPVGPDLIREHMRLKDRILLSTACTTGREKTAEAFREKGNFYAGPSGYVEGTAALMFVLRFLYEWIAKNADPGTAAELAASADEETGSFLKGKAWE